MRRSMWLNALLAAAAVALGAFLYLRPARDAPAEHALSTLDPRKVGSIRIERPGAAPVLVEKRGDAWFVSMPFAARADALRVQDLLAIAAAKSPHRLPAADLARFELERPQARLTLDAQSFGFGMVNALTREQYVLAGGAVYAVPARYGAALPKSPGQVASRQLFGAAEAPVRIALKDFTVELRDGQWTLAPRAADLGQEDLARWVDEWRLASALAVEPRVKGKPLSAARVRLKGDTELTVSVLAREPELVLARSDEQVQYRFRAGLAQRLLIPPGTEQRKTP